MDSPDMESAESPMRARVCGRVRATAASREIEKLGGDDGDNDDDGGGGGGGERSRGGLVVYRRDGRMMAKKKKVVAHSLKEGGEWDTK